MNLAELRDIKVIDADTHITEPPDLWTRRISTKKWRDEVLHVRQESGRGGLAWFIGDSKVADAPAGANGAWLRHADYPPARPHSYEDIMDAAFAVEPRIKWMDTHGIYAQVIYPNVGGFGSARFLKIKDAGLRLEHVRVYNDFLTEWSSAASGRLLPIAALPLWDIDEAIKEVDRAAKMGHRGILMSYRPETMGLPMLSDRRWDPLWAAAEARSLPINFHIGSGGEDVIGELGVGADHMGVHGAFARASVLFFMDNARAVTEIIAGGVCHRFPDLKFVSVESGIGWVPFLMEAFDWQWKNTGVHEEHPEYDLLPSEYFRRQWSACFWFEKESPKRVIDFIGPQSVLFETDFPHPTSLTPGPKSVADSPRKHYESVFEELPVEWAKQILWDNPAKLYGVQ